MNYYNFVYRRDEKMPLALFNVNEGFCKGTMFSNIYENYKAYKPKTPIALNEQSAMMMDIQEYAQAAHDLNLYLDLYPFDKEAINKFSSYQKEMKKALMFYEEKYGPITMSSELLKNEPWGWDVTKWPWEGDF